MNAKRITWYLGVLSVVIIIIIIIIITATGLSPGGSGYKSGGLHE